MVRKFVDAVGFDLDNTLYVMTEPINTKITDYLLQQASSRLRQPLAVVREAYDRIHATTQSARRTLAALGITEPALLVQEALEHADIASLLQPDQRLISLLGKLQEHYRLFLITGSSEQQSEDKLQALGIQPTLFDPRLYSGSPYERHNGTAFTHVATTLGFRVDRLFFVGDRETVDILPAKASGVTTAIVNAKSEHATYQLETLYDLEKILLGDA